MSLPFLMRCTGRRLIVLAVDMSDHACTERATPPAHEAVFMWRRVPPRHAIRVAQMLKLPMHEVCPEVWPKKPHGKKKPPEDSPCDVIR